MAAAAQLPVMAVQEDIQSPPREQQQLAGNRRPRVEETPQRAVRRRIAPPSTGTRRSARTPRRRVNYQE